MFELIARAKAGLALFRVGSEIANAEKWKAGQIQGTLVAAFILAAVNLAEAFGYKLPVTADAANAIGAGLVAAVNVVLTAVTSARAGLLPPAAGQRPGAADAGQPGGLPGVSAVAPAAGGELQHVAEPAVQAGAPGRYSYINGEQYEFHG